MLRRDPNPEGSFVYVIGPDSGVLVKVGVADFPAHRLAQLQTGSPDELSILHQVPVERAQAFAIEHHAHRLLSKHHKRGEWFSIDAATALAAVLKAKRAEALLRKPRAPKASETDPAAYLIRKMKLGSFGRNALAEYRSEMSGGSPIRARNLERFLRDECGHDHFEIFNSFAMSEVNIFALLGNRPDQLQAAEDAVGKVLRKVIAVAGWTSRSVSHRFAA